MIIRLLLILVAGVALSCQPASAAKYKCKDKDGNWTEAACTGAAAPPPPPEDKAAKMQERRTGWRKLCDSSSWSYTNSCIDDHERNYAEMNNILIGPPSDLQNKAAACYLQWFKEAAGVVDAKMWRYCYYNN